MRFLLLLACSLTLLAQGDFYLKDGDTVVFYGDSITDQRLYTTFTEAYVLTRFPKLNIRFVHSGWPGDTVDGGAGGPIDVRLARDVLAYHPTVVTIMLGMNDGRYRAFDPAIFKTYSTGYERIVKVLKEGLPNVRITALEPSAYDDVTRAPQFDGGYNGVLVRFGSFIRELAEREHLLRADLNAGLVAMLQKAYVADSTLSQKLIPDRVHPAAPTHYVMAEALLKSWNATALVSAVEIDATSRAVRTASNTSVSVLPGDANLAWTQLDSALPLPMERFPSKELLQLAFASSDVIDNLDRETLSVGGLPDGQYTLKVDEQAIVTHSADEWRAGVNLAELDTPMSKQASEVLQLIYRHNVLHWARWHLIQTSFDPPYEKPRSMDSTMTALDTMDAEVAAMARARAQPRLHRFELVPM
ncbi:MAG TPA: SGNH/GDSL hydrolase family protein [Bryobacteraceae bacterium]|nr:SGNH/GDSL hydrolase family protein [Bryobacteraceae bacterium]